MQIHSVMFGLTDPDSSPVVFLEKGEKRLALLSFLKRDDWGRVSDWPAPNGNTPAHLKCHLKVHGGRLLGQTLNYLTFYDVTIVTVLLCGCTT